MSHSTDWTTAVDEQARHLTDLCDQLAQAPLADRLHALSTLNAAFADLYSCAQREAIQAAREQGWPLRRIATALNCSHEQIRLLLAT
ncbi:helix-turn-helix domain-containing protein [Streptomyces bacillaris]|uniref:helix-turn-helix domain-containing protein n=1 Tax=Streptomyces bacillaris TaxID=68179 RepID=UPI003EBFF654